MTAGNRVMNEDDYFEEYPDARAIRRAVARAVKQSARPKRGCQRAKLGSNGGIHLQRLGFGSGRCAFPSPQPHKLSNPSRPTTSISGNAGWSGN